MNLQSFYLFFINTIKYLYQHAIKQNIRNTFVEYSQCGSTSHSTSLRASSARDPNGLLSMHRMEENNLKEEVL